MVYTKIAISGELLYLPTPMGNKCDNMNVVHENVTCNMFYLK